MHSIAYVLLRAVVSSHTNLFFPWLLNKFPSALFSIASQVVSNDRKSPTFLEFLAGKNIVILVKIANKDDKDPGDPLDSN